MKTTRWVGVVIALGALAGAGVLWWVQPDAQRASVAPVAPITIALNPVYAGSALIVLADRNGYFTDERLDVVLQSSSSGRAAIGAALEGKADLATVSDVAYVDAVKDGTPGAIVATIFRASNDHGIVGRVDRGFRTLADLRGKRIGVTPGTSGDFVLDGFLLREGLSAADVAVRGYKPAQFQGAMANGEIDAVVSWEPVLGTLRDWLGADNAALFYSEGIYELTFNLAGRRDWVQANPEPVRRLLQALLRAERFVREQPDRARAQIAEFTKADPDRLAAQWPSYQYRVALDQSLLVALEDVARWAARAAAGSALPAVNFLDHLHVQTLAALSPDAVTVIR